MLAKVLAFLYNKCNVPTIVLVGPNLNVVFTNSEQHKNIKTHTHIEFIYLIAVCITFQLDTFNKA